MDALLDFITYNRALVVYLLSCLIRGLLGYWFVPKMGWTGSTRWGLWALLTLSPSPILFLLLVSFLKWPIETKLDELRRSPKRK